MSDTCKLGIDCKEPMHAGGWGCKEHGCAICGHVILADTDEWQRKLCASHYEAFLAWVLDRLALQHLDKLDEFAARKDGVVT